MYHSGVGLEASREGSRPDAFFHPSFKHDRTTAFMAVGGDGGLPKPGVAWKAGEDAGRCGALSLV
jgi:hypothetical protein